MSVTDAMADSVVERAPPLLRVLGLAKRYGEQQALAVRSAERLPPRPRIHRQKRGVAERPPGAELLALSKSQCFGHEDQTR